MQFPAIKIRIEHLWALLVVVGIFAFVNTHPIRPNDFWFHIATARETLQTGQIPQVDQFSYFHHGEIYLSNNRFWLMQIIMYMVYTGWGAAWVVMATSLLVTGAYGLLLWLGLTKSGNWRAAAFGTLFAATLGLDNWNVRPQTATYLLAVLILWGIYQYQRTHQWRWILLFPCVMAIWVNSHGSFFIGLALIGFWAAESVWQTFWRWKIERKIVWIQAVPQLIAGGLAGLACLVNPEGSGVINYLTSMSGSPIIQNYVLEWQPLDFRSTWGIIFMVSVIGVGIILLKMRPRVGLFHILCYLFFGALSLKYGRAVVWFGIVMAPIVSEGLANLNRFSSRTANNHSTLSPAQTKLNKLVLGMILFLALFSLPWFKSYWPVQPEKRGILAYDTPLNATEFLLETGMPQPVFHDLAFGSYMTWAAYPKYRVFVDPRFELYPESTWKDYVLISAGASDWEERLKSYEIKTLMLHIDNQAALINAVQNNEDWEELYSDGAAVIFTLVEK